MSYSYEVIRGMKTCRAHTRAYCLDDSSFKQVTDLMCARLSESQKTEVDKSVRESMQLIFLP